MFNHFFNKKKLAGRGVYKQYAAMEIGMRLPSSRARLVVRQVTWLIGIMATCLLLLMFANPKFAGAVLAFSPYSNADTTTEEQWDRLTRSFYDAGADNPALQSVSFDPDTSAGEKGEREKQRVTQWIARRYRVADEAADVLVSEAYAAAEETNLDPLLILSVIAIESRFNPIAESPVGAQGLMQVMPKVHSDKFDDHGGLKAALDPAANIKVGSQILKEYVRRGGSVEAGLKTYVGAAMLPTDGGYGAKVLSEYHRLKLVARGKRVPITANSLVIRTKAAVTPHVSHGTRLANQDGTIASLKDKKVNTSM